MTDVTLETFPLFDSVTIKALLTTTGTRVECAYLPRGYSVTHGFEIDADDVQQAMQQAIVKLTGRHRLYENKVKP